MPLLNLETGICGVAGPASLQSNWAYDGAGLLPVGMRSVGRFFLFIAGGIAVIIVGFFMLRGNMRMWDRSKPDAGDDGGDGDDAAAATDGN